MPDRATMQQRPQDLRQRLRDSSQPRTAQQGGIVQLQSVG